jgi:hypothetical protein
VVEGFKVTPESALQRADAREQCVSQRRSVLVAQAAHHAGFDPVHLGIAARQERPSLGGEPSLEDSTMLRMGVTPHETALLQREQHFVHRLR